MRNKLHSIAGRIAASALALTLVFSLSATAFAEGNEGSEKDYFDLSGISRTPAGAYGDLKPKDGNLQFVSNDEQVDIRFYGVTVDLSKGIPSQDQASAMAQKLHSRGFNIIKLNNVYASIGSGNGLNDAKMAEFDKFVNEMYKQGIYIYLNMFTPESLSTTSVGLFVDTSVVSTAQRFLKSFLDHENTRGVIYSKDSSIAVIQYCSDASVVWQPNGNISAYSSALTSKFNIWLNSRYNESDIKLSETWTDRYLQSCLKDGESISASNIALANPASGNSETAFNWSDSPARTADSKLFMIEQEQTALKNAQTLVNNLGFTGIFIASDTSSGPASTMLAGNCDAAAKTVNYSSDMSDIDTLAAFGSGVISDKPFFAQWNTAASSHEIVSRAVKLCSYASFQDWDGFILGDYDSVVNNKDLWDISGFLGNIFRNKQVAPSITSAEVVYTEADTLCESGNYGKVNGYMSLFSKVGNTFVKNEYKGKSDIVISSGNTASGTYTAAAAAILQSAVTYTDQYESDSNKSVWYNNQVEAKIMDVYDINDTDVHIGDKRAILTSGVIDSVSSLGQILSKIDAYKGGKLENGAVISDNEQLTYDLNTNKLTSLGKKTITTSGRKDDISLGDFTISPDKECDFILYTLDKSYLSDSNDYLISCTPNVDGQAVTTDIKINRANSDMYVYGINSDGSRAGSIPCNVDKASGTCNVTLEGYAAYEIVFTERAVDDDLENYEWKPIRHPNVFLLIALPALGFLAIVITIVALNNKRKLKREELMRKETLEIKRRQNAEHLKKYHPFDED